MLSILDLEYENERIEELNSFQILDSIPEQDYDNITSLAADICLTKISLVSLVDANRQWFKSHHGLAASETPRTQSFSAYAINDSEDVFVIKDARKDDRFADNPLVLNEPYIVFYAGVSLVTSQGFPLGTLCVIDTEPRQLNSRQKKSLKTLAKQVVNLLELRKKKRLLEESFLELDLKNNRLQQLTYIAAHDLQEPLRTIKHFAEYIDTNYQSKFDEKGQTSINYIKQASERVSLLIKGLMDYSLIGNYDKTSLVDFNKIVKTILEDLQVLIKESNANIKVGKLPRIIGHKTELRILIQNLITNAIKFSRNGIYPEINIYASRKDGFWIFAVKDNGIGIESKHQEKIFKIFQRLHPKNEYGGGTGIGLSHCQKIVEIHGGKIWFASHLNEGSTFYFTIPC